jgi:hypothetical protein
MNLLLLFYLSLCDREKNIRTNMLNKTDINVRPVKNHEDSVDSRFSLSINSLEYFDQVSEKIKFNFEFSFFWNDEYINWDYNQTQIEELNIDPALIWKPNLELYNSASYPDLILNEGLTRINYQGNVTWILPILYSFSCSLNLEDFPFDTQECSMSLGSWKFTKQYLDIRIINEINFDNFKHNEWDIIEADGYTEDLEYLCCPNDYFPTTTVNIYIQRNYNKYLIVIIMTIILTLAALSVSTISVDKYRRTFILVFIPLTIIWLQLYISSKIPVIEHTTKMEQFLQLSYYVIFTCTFESCLLFCLLNTYHPFLNNYFKKRNKIKIYDNSEKIIVNKYSFSITNKNEYPDLLKIVKKLDDIFRFSILVTYIIGVSVILNTP